MDRKLRIAVAQSTVPTDPGDRAALRAAGEEIRGLMRRAADAGARLLQLPEGALVYPDKRVMSSAGPGTVAASDWGRAAWEVLREEAEAIAGLAGQLGLWTVLGSIHPLTAPLRPHNSLYVISDTGRLVGRYDKRLLSNTEASFMYSPGSDPLVFTVDGIRFGTALCIEASFPELFEQYEQLDADVVLLSLMVDDAPRALLAQAYAVLHCYWVGYAIPAQYSATAPSGLVAPGGRWIARCPGDGRPALAVADIDPDSTDPDIDVAVRLARPWRRSARAARPVDQAVLADPRSRTRTTF